jgi:NitT/TauT family transport system substrate-binding protein
MTRAHRFWPVLLCLALASAARAQERVRLGNLKFAHYGAVSYTRELGPRCGLTVEERVFPKGPDVMQAIVAGELDVGATASEAAINARAAGVPIVIVAGFAKGGARLVVRPDLPAKRVEDLKGTRVGVTRGGIQEVLLASELAMHGLSWSDQPGKDVHVVYLAFPDLNQALLQKNIDAMMQSEPYSSKAIHDGLGRELLKPYDTPLGMPVRTLVMTEKFLAEQRPVALKFLRCFLLATRAFTEDRALASRYVRQTLFKGQVSEADFEEAIANSPYTDQLSVEHIQLTADTMARYGVGKLARVPVAADFVKLELLEEARRAPLPR